MPKSGTMTGVIRNVTPDTDKLTHVGGPSAEATILELEGGESATLDPALPRVDEYWQAIRALQKAAWPGYFGLREDSSRQTVQRADQNEISHWARTRV